jgi:hypothetical protein
MDRMSCVAGGEPRLAPEAPPGMAAAAQRSEAKTTFLPKRAEPRAWMRG